MCLKKMACFLMAAIFAVATLRSSPVVALDESEGGGQGSSSSAADISPSARSPANNGARRGQSTNVLIAMIDFLQGFSESDQQLICSVQNALKRLDPSDPDAVHAFLAGYLVDRLQKPEDVILAMLKDPSLCENTVRKIETPVAAKERPFWIAEDGLPYSFVNPFWNDCIRGKVFSKAQVLANPDIGPRGHLTCGDYYSISDGVAYWRRPGINNGEQALFQYDSRTKVFTVLSENYYIAYVSKSPVIAEANTL